MGLFYQKRRLKVNKIKRQINSTRANLQHFRILLSLLIIVLIVYSGLKILKLPQWYLNINKLNAADPKVLRIQGNVITPTSKIIEAIRQTQLPNTQIFRLDTDELRDNITQLQVIKKTYIRRYWFPARLLITVEERTPVFLLAPNLEAAPRCALTSDGIIIDHDYLPFDSSIKTKTLLTYGVRDGIDETWDKKKVEDLIKIVKAFEFYSNQEVQYIDLRNQKDVYVMLKEYLIRLGEINDTTFDRIRWIASILPEAKRINKNIKYIDLRWQDSYYLRLDGANEDEKPKEIIKNEDRIEGILKLPKTKTKLNNEAQETNQVQTPNSNQTQSSTQDDTETSNKPTPEEIIPD